MARFRTDSHSLEPRHGYDSQSLESSMTLVRNLPSCALGEEVAQLEVLEGQWRAALDKLKHKKKQARQLEGDLQVCH